MDEKKLQTLAKVAELLHPELRSTLLSLIEERTAPYTLGPADRIVTVWIGLYTCPACKEVREMTPATRYCPNCGVRLEHS